jgi:hypothetical protein
MYPKKLILSMGEKSIMEGTLGLAPSFANIYQEVYHRQGTKGEEVSGDKLGKQPGKQMGN